MKKCRTDFFPPFLLALFEPMKSLSCAAEWILKELWCKGLGVKKAAAHCIYKCCMYELLAVLRLHCLELLGYNWTDHHSNKWKNESCEAIKSGTMKENEKMSIILKL